MYCTFICKHFCINIFLLGHCFKLHSNIIRTPFCKHTRLHLEVVFTGLQHHDFISSQTPPTSFSHLFTENFLWRGRHTAAYSHINIYVQQGSLMIMHLITTMVYSIMIAHHHTLHKPPFHIFPLPFRQKNFFMEGKTAACSHINICMMYIMHNKDHALMIMNFVSVYSIMIGHHHRLHKPPFHVSPLSLHRECLYGMEGDTTA